MSGFAMLAPFAFVGIIALGSIAVTLRNALPRIAQLRAELAGCPANLEYTFRISEVTCRWNDGHRNASHWNDSTVVALPVRPRQGHPLAAHQAGLRAAA